MKPLPHPLDHHGHGFDIPHKPQLAYNGRRRLTASLYAQMTELCTRIDDRISEALK